MAKLKDMLQLRTFLMWKVERGERPYSRPTSSNPGERAPGNSRQETWVPKKV